MIGGLVVGRWDMEIYQFSVPQIDYHLEGSRTKGGHVYFLLIVVMVLLLWHQIVQLWHQVTMVASEQQLYQTMVLPRKLTTGSIHDYLFCYCPLVGILYELPRISKTHHWLREYVYICFLQNIIHFGQKLSKSTYKLEKSFNSSWPYKKATIF